MSNKKDLVIANIASEPSLTISNVYREDGVLKEILTRVETQEAFEQVKAQHLYNLEQIRKFILGDEYNQPQVTYVPEIAKFDSKITDIREWIESSYHNNEGSDSIVRFGYDYRQTPSKYPSNKEIEND